MKEKYLIQLQWPHLETAHFHPVNIKFGSQFPTKLPVSGFSFINNLHLGDFIIVIAIIANGTEINCP